jgi:predicted phage terminase large subunit-like protein
MDVAKLAANNFTAYKVVMNKQYERARHVDLLDRVLMEVARYLETGQGIQNLIVELPPRSSKTLSISEMFPGWVKGRRPDTDIILASYGASLAEMASRRARDYVNSPEYKAIFPDTRPDDALQKAGEWGVIGPNGEKSHMVAVGLGGALVGKGAHCFPAGTMVHTERGLMDIKELCESLDPPHVLSYNFKTDELEYQTVEAVSNRCTDHFIEIKMYSGNSITATPEHPFYFPSGFSVRADQIKPDDTFLTHDRKHDKVKSVHTSALYGEKVYDFQVQKNHNFFANGLLVSNCIIVDDPIKNRIEAENPTIRQQVWEAYTNDLLSRFNTSARAAQIITAQRYHVDDLIGRILASSQAKKWHRLRLPAIAEENDPLGREIGEPLWPERYSLEALLEIEERDSYSFASQYQQRPIPRGETMFDATKIITVAEPPPLTGVVRFWDIAVTTKKRNDYTVGLKLGITANEEIIVLDVWRGKVRAPDMLDLITRIAHQDGQHVAQVLEGEKAGIMQLDYLLNEPKLRGFTLVTQPIQGDKLTRASGIATRVQYERVAMVKGIWNDAFISEVAVYPASNHDDQVDALSGAYKYLSELGLKTFTVENLGTVDRW